MFAASGWRKSTRCETSACVEVAVGGALVGLRNSTKPDTRLAIDAGAWRQFIDGVRTGDFDRPA
jgi:Domain of unknown function (DUF397)